MSRKLSNVITSNKGNSMELFVNVLNWAIPKTEVNEMLKKYNVVSLECFVKNYRIYKADKMRNILSAVVGIVVKKHFKCVILKKSYFLQWDISDFMGNVVSVYVNINKHTNIEFIEEGNLVILVNPDIHRRNEYSGDESIDFYNLHDIINVGKVAYMHKCKARNIYNDTCPYLLYVPRQGYFCSHHIGSQSRSQSYSADEGKNCLVFEFPIIHNTEEDSTEEDNTEEQNKRRHNAKEDNTQKFSHSTHKLHANSLIKPIPCKKTNFKNSNHLDNDMLSEYNLNANYDSTSDSIHFYESLSERNDTNFLSSSKEKSKQNPLQLSRETVRVQKPFEGKNEINKPSDEFCYVHQSLYELNKLRNRSDQAYIAHNTSSRKFGAQNMSGGTYQAQNTSGGMYEAQNTSGGIYGAQNTLRETYGAQNTSGGIYQAQNTSGGMYEAQNTSGGIYGAQNTLRETYGAQNTSGGIYGAQNTSGGIYGAQNTLRETYGAQNTSSGTYQPQNTSSGTYQPQNTSSGTYQPQNTSSGAYQPQNTSSGTYQPQNTSSGTYQPQNTSSGTYQPQNTSSGTYQPQNTSSGTYQPQNTSSGTYQPQNTSSGTYQPQNTSSGTYQPQNTSSGTYQPQNTSSGTYQPQNTSSGIYGTQNMSSGINGTKNMSSGIYGTQNMSSGIYGAHKSCDGTNRMLKSLNREKKVDNLSYIKNILQQQLFPKEKTGESLSYMNQIQKLPFKRSRIIHTSDAIKEIVQPHQRKKLVEKKGCEKNEVEKKGCEKNEVEKKGCEKNEVEKKGCEKNEVEKKGCEKNEVEKKGCEKNEVEKKGCEKKEVEKKGCENKGCENKGCENKGCEKNEVENKGCENKGCEKKEVEKKGCENKGCENKGCEKKEVEKKGCENKGCEKNEVEKKGCEKKEVEKKGCENKGCEKKEVEKKGCENKGCEKNEVEKTSYEQNEVEKTSYEQKEILQLLQKFNKLFQKRSSKVHKMKRKRGREEDDNKYSSDSFIKRKKCSKMNPHNAREGGCGTYLKTEDKYGKMNIFINGNKMNQNKQLLPENEERKVKNILDENKKEIDKKSTNYDVYNDLNNCGHKNVICIECLNRYRRKNDSAENSNECGKHIYGEEKKTEDNIKTVILDCARENDIEIDMGEEIKNNEKFIDASVGYENKLNTNGNEENTETLYLMRPFHAILNEIENAEKEGEKGIDKIVMNIKNITRNFIYYADDFKNTRIIKICERLMLHKSMYIAILALDLRRKIGNLKENQEVETNVQI
ncbi:hypothetical protein PFHG_00087 [Plasmodium falciparum HB3]|uniref:Nucleoporin NUP116/NSP116 n=1 Tax=Plasmodium falciparum (isolate HB3) TaxID=137071 RepID=A0A0L7K635_PLAFX|nr:hypothetical protein PFHG_00087 [Plasmodium falciparum HB3]